MTQDTSSEANAQAADFDINTIAVLPPTWVDNVFAQAFKQLDPSQNPYSNADEMKHTTIQTMLDNFCSLDPSLFNESFSQFLQITCLQNEWSQIPEDYQSQAISIRIRDLPELQLLYTGMQIASTYDFLNEKVLTTQDVDEFREQYLQIQENLSPEITANLEHQTIKLYQSCSDKAEMRDFTPLYYNILANSNNPTAIVESFEHLPYSRINNYAAQQSCRRILRDYKGDLSNQDLYYLYTTLGKTYQREPRRAGFIQPSKLKSMQTHNLEAARWYKKAYTVAPTPFDKIETVRSIKHVAPDIYIKQYAKRYPARLFDAPTPRTPYSSGGNSGNTRN